MSTVSEGRALFICVFICLYFLYLYLYIYLFILWIKGTRLRALGMKDLRFIKIHLN